MRLIAAILYRPFALIAGILAGILTRRAFGAVWQRVDEEDPPKAHTEEASWGKILAAAALEGMIFRVSLAATERWSAKLFYYLIGIWPGERKPDQTAAE